MSTSTNRLAVAAGLVAVTTAGLALLTTSADAQTARHLAPRCTNSALTVTRTFVQGAAGHSGMSLIYRNSTTRSCSVGGYPGVDAVTAHGQVLAHAERVSAHRPRTITIKPGGFASAPVLWRDFTGATGRTCRTGAVVDTIVANTTRVHRLPVAVGTCHLQVGATVAGVPGYPHYAQAQFDWNTISTVDAQGRHVLLLDVAGQLKAGAYPTQYAQARQLAGFPGNGLTASQARRARADVRALEAFFASTARV